LFKAHDAVYDEENAWIVAVQPETDIYTPGASPCAMRVAAALRAGVTRGRSQVDVHELPDFRLQQAACRWFFIGDSGEPLEHMQKNHRHGFRFRLVDRWNDRTQNARQSFAHLLSRHPVTLEFTPDLIVPLAGALAVGLFMSVHFGKVWRDKHVQSKPDSPG
jgi:hypothetical protein